MSHLGSQTIIIHIFPNISQIKENQTMKFGQLIEYKVSDNYLSSEITAENKTGNLVSDIFI